MAVTAASGTKAYERGRTMERVTVTLPNEVKQELENAASMSGMKVSSYLQALLTVGFPNGLPHFGMALIGVDGTLTPLSGTPAKELGDKAA